MNGFRVNQHSDLKFGEPYLFLMSQPHVDKGLECIWMVLILKILRCRSGGSPQYCFVNPITERQIWFSADELFKMLIFKSLHDGYGYVDQIVRRALGGKDDSKRKSDQVDSQGA